MEVRFQRSLLPIIIAIITISRRHLDDDFENNSLINKADQQGGGQNFDQFSRDFFILFRSFLKKTGVVFVLFFVNSLLFEGVCTYFLRRNTTERRTKNKNNSKITRIQE